MLPSFLDANLHLAVIPTCIHVCGRFNWLHTGIGVTQVFFISVHGKGTRTPGSALSAPPHAPPEYHTVSQYHNRGFRQIHSRINNSRRMISFRETSCGANQPTSRPTAPHRTAAFPTSSEKKKNKNTCQHNIRRRGVYGRHDASKTDRLTDEKPVADNYRVFFCCCEAAFFRHNASGTDRQID